MQTTPYSKLLPDAFKKSISSNNEKLLRINMLAIDEFKGDIAEVIDVLDLNNATGKTLDLYGEMVGQKRGSADDTQYRVLIIAQIAKNMSKGTYNDCMQAIKHSLGLSDGEVTMIEHENRCAVMFTKFPATILLRTGLNTVQMYNLIKSLIPAGVELILDWFDGTFELGEEENEIDNEKGLADDDLTIGGYLGVAYKEDIQEG